jgi:hypothetical protein
MKYFLGFFITIGLIILLIILLVGGGKPEVPSTSKALDTYSGTSAEASLLIDGPINARSKHQAIRITVGRDSVTYEELRGYDNNTVELKTFSNTENSYDVFLHALERAGFTNGDTSKALADEKGQCPQGNRYVFMLEQGGRTLERFWASSCGGAKSYLGNLETSLQIFQNQVPDYFELSRDIAL